jgi:hypothetical protein
LDRDNLKNVLSELINEFGEVATEAAIKELLGVANSRTPAPDYSQILTPEKVAATIEQSDAATAEVLAVAGELPALLKRKYELETEIKLAEASAFMNAGSDGKNIVVEVNGRSLALSNAELRESYSRNLTAVQRRELATVTGNIEAINSEVARIESANQNIRAKAELQASLLRYLAR